MLSTKLTPIASHHEVSGTMETTLPSTTSASRDADAIEAISQVGPVVTRQPVSSHATRKTVPQATPTPGPCQIPSRQATPPAATSSITPSSTENLLVTITAAMMGLESTPNEILPHSTEIVPAEVIVPTADDNSIVKSLETRQQSLVSLSPIASVSTSPAIDISLDDESASGVISYDTKPAASDVVPSVVSTAIDSQHGG